jgi:VanZ family protein
LEDLSLIGDKPLKTYTKILAIGIILILLGVGFKLSSIPGQKTSQFLENTKFVYQLAQLFIPMNMSLKYEDKIIENKQTEVYGEAYSGGTLSYTNSPDAKIELEFKGTGLEWYGFKTSYNGFAEVWIDGKYQANVNLYSSHVIYSDVLFSISGLTNESHQLSIQATEVLPSHAKGSSMGIDYFLIMNDEQNMKIENNDNRIKYINANSYYYVQFVLRKLAHFLIFFFTTIILITFRKWIGLNRKKTWLILPIMLIWALLDEYHQSFVPGRNPSLSDVLIDSTGIIMAFMVYLGARIILRRLTRGRLNA